jgi:aminopeptidase N
MENRMSKLLRAWGRLGVLLLLVSLLAPQASLALAAKARPQNPKPVARPFPPTQYVPSHDFDTKHIALDLRFDWEQQQVIGVETITLSPLTKGLERIELDAAEMAFTKISLASGASLNYEFDIRKQKLWITLDHPYQLADVLTLVIEYRTNGQSRLTGLVGGGLRFIKPTADDPARPKQIWSQGESEYNHYWFPCYDHPNDFFTSEIYATVEKPLTVISNGKLLETKDNGKGARTFHWKIDQPHAAYLTSIVVGEYTPITQEYEGIPVITYVYPNEVAEGKVTAARLSEMVKFFSEKTGLKYPYAKYAQTMARDFGGGMENISATTQTDKMIHDARTELDQTSDGLQSHELAHQWFGDYVTCRSWADIWLNESFATYFQALWDEHHLGHDDFLYLDVKGNQDQYYNTWKLGNRRPIVTENYNNPDSVFDTYAYPRGGAVLHMLRTYLGEDNWWRSINHYLTKYANQPVETAQFRIAIEETTGQSMDWFFDEWLYRMGHPVFQITKQYDPAAKRLALTVKQTQKADSESQYPQVKFFQTPVDIEIGSKEGTHIERVKIEPVEEQTFTFALESEPTLVNFDYGSTLIKQVDFKKGTDELIHQVAYDQDVTGRLWALGELKALLRDVATADPERERITRQVADTLQHDKFWGLRVESATALAAGSGIARQALIEATKDSSAKVRASVVTALGEFKDPTLAGTYLALLHDQSYAVTRAAALALGQTKSADAYEALAQLADLPSWRNSIKISALMGLAALADKRALELAVRYSGKDTPSAVRSPAIRLLGIIGKDDPRSFAIVSQAISQAIDLQDFSLAGASAETLAALGDRRGLAVFDSVRKKAEGTLFSEVLKKSEERLRLSTM